jgi:hypothetical protein
MVLETGLCNPYVMVLRDDFPQETNRTGEGPAAVIFDHASRALAVVDASGDDMLFIASNRAGRTNDAPSGRCFSV